MKKRFLVLLLLVSTLCIIGCSKKGSQTETDKIMNVPIDNISSIDVYSKGEKSTLSVEDDSFEELVNIINENDDSVGILDGGLGVDMATLETDNYSDFSKKKECTLYIINFSKTQSAKYTDIEYSNNITAIFAIPEINYIGLVINDADTGKLSYATFSNTDKDMFENFN